jgi:ADP-ribose pyrophosphatase
MSDLPAQPPARRSRRVYAGRLLNVDLDTVQMPDGSALDLEMVRHPGAAAVVPLLSDPKGPDPQVLLIRQFRHAAGGPIWEIPAGVLEPGEAPEDCARRELEEETGAQARDLEYLTTIFTTPGFTDERIHLFWATGLRLGEPKPMADEFLKVEARPLSRVLEMVRDGEIVDAKSVVALLYVAGFKLGL